MVDWLSSMQQTFEYYIVDPNTWRDDKQLKNVKSCTISRDSEADTLGSATIDVTESVGECYIRVYLITIQNGVKEKHPLGTFLVQTPSSSFNGKVRNVSMDAYTPLLELKENPPPIGYSLLKGENIMSNAYQIVRDNVRAPVVPATCDKTLYADFVANTSDKWVTFVRDLIGQAKYVLTLDEMGRVLFSPKQELDSLQPVWTFDDSDKSILYTDIDFNHDLYDVPNVVEVIYSNGKDHFYGKAVNDDPNSPVSTVSRGRTITHIEPNPGLTGESTEAQIQEYAELLLRELSTLKYTVSYTHGYCPVRLGDCVRLNYTKAGLTNIRARVISQNIKCTPGCPVSEKAEFTVKLWR